MWRRIYINIWRKKVLFSKKQSCRRCLQSDVRWCHPSRSAGGPKQSGQLGGQRGKPYVTKMGWRIGLPWPLLYARMPERSPAWSQWPFAQKISLEGARCQRLMSCPPPSSKLLNFSLAKTLQTLFSLLLLRSPFKCFMAAHEKIIQQSLHATTMSQKWKTRTALGIHKNTASSGRKRNYGGDWPRYLRWACKSNTEWRGKVALEGLMMLWWQDTWAVTASCERREGAAVDCINSFALSHGWNQRWNGWDPAGFLLKYTEGVSKQGEEPSFHDRALHIRAIEFGLRMTIDKCSHDQFWWRGLVFLQD